MSVSQAVQNPRAFIGGTWQKYRTLLFDPDTFYDEYVGTHGINREVGLVLAIGLVGAVGTLYAVVTILGPWATSPVEPGPSLSQNAQLVLWRRVVDPVAGAFALWLGFGGALYVGSWLYSPVGGIYRFLKNTAWGLFPMLFANLLYTLAIAASTYTSQEAIENQTDDPPGGTAENIANELWAVVAADPLVVGAVALGIVFALWSGYLLAHGIVDIRDLDIDEAYRVVAVPTLAYVAYVVVQVLSTEVVAVL